MPAPKLQGPQLDVRGDTLAVTWTQPPVRMVFRNCVRAKWGSVDADVIVESLGSKSLGKRLHGPARISINNTSHQTGLARAMSDRVALSEATNLALWSTVVAQSCSVVCERWDIGEPFVLLHTVPPERTSELVQGLIPLGQTSIICGDGESAKSLVALSLALSLATGVPMPSGLAPAAVCPVLYLDWETDAQEQRYRMWRLATGYFGQDSLPEVHYRAMVKPLAEDIQRIRDYVSENKILFVVVDSLGPAAGEMESTDSAMRVMHALRQLGAGVTKLVVAHVTKASAEGNGHYRPIGSAFFYNLARSVWECRRADDDRADSIRVGLFCVKSNAGQRGHPIGLEFAFDTGEADSILIFAHSIRDDADLVKHAPLKTRIYHLLATNWRAMTVEQLAEELEQKPQVVRARLSDGNVFVRVSPPEQRTGVLWGLKSNAGDNDD